LRDVVRALYANTHASCVTSNSSGCRVDISQLHYFTYWSARCSSVDEAWTDIS